MGLLDNLLGGDEIDRLERDVRKLGSEPWSEKGHKSYQMGIARLRHEYQEEARREGRRYGDRRFEPRGYRNEPIPGSFFEWLLR